MTAPFAKPPPACLPARAPARSSRSTVLVMLILAGACCLPACRRKAPPGNYDLVAESVTPQRAAPRTGERTGFDCVVRNLGTDTVPARTFHVDFYINGALTNYDHGTHALPPTGAGRIRYGFYFQPAVPGRYEYRLVIDKHDCVAETDEGNNVIEGAIEVAP